MARVVQVPDIRKVDLPEARQAIPHVHAYLRQCILCLLYTSPSPRDRG